MTQAAPGAAPAPIEVRDLTKRFGSVEAVRGLSFDVAPGRVTGFLGPNGAGKSTTLRALLGLVRPTAGTATFAGRRFEQLDQPSRHVGAVLEDVSLHPGRSGRNHLRVLAALGGVPEWRVDEVLELVGMREAADRRAKGYSMGMRQRIAIAAALLGEPKVLILDEPANGLDPPAIRWLRVMLREQADNGTTVLVSSHLLAEVAQSVDDVIVISRGTLRAQGSLEQVLGSGEAPPETEVRSPEAERLAGVLAERGMTVERLDADGVLVRGADPAAVGGVAAEQGIVVTGLSARARSLEDAFLRLVEEPPR